MKQLLVMMMALASLLAIDRHHSHRDELPTLDQSTDELILLMELLAQEQATIHHRPSHRADKPKNTNTNKNKNKHKKNRPHRNNLALPKGEGQEGDNDGWDRPMHPWNLNHKEPRIPSEEAGKRLLKKYGRTGHGKLARGKTQRSQGQPKKHRSASRSEREGLRLLHKVMGHSRRKFHPHRATKGDNDAELKRPIVPWRKASKKAKRHQKRLQALKGHKDHQAGTRKNFVVINEGKPTKKGHPYFEVHQINVTFDVNMHQDQQALAGHGHHHRHHRHGGKRGKKSKMLQGGRAASPLLMAAKMAPSASFGEEELSESYEMRPPHNRSPPDLAYGDDEPRKRKKCVLAEWGRRIKSHIKRMRRRLQFESWSMRAALGLALSAIITMQIWVVCQCISFIKGDADYEKLPEDDEDEDEEKGFPGSRPGRCVCSQESTGKGPAEQACMMENKKGPISGL